MATTLLPKAKNALRISTANSAFDTEVTDLINAAERDIAETGITLGEDDSLVAQAVITYVKAHFGWNNPDADALQEVYASLLKKMTLVEDYTREVEPNAVE